MVVNSDGQPLILDDRVNSTLLFEPCETSRSCHLDFELTKPMILHDTRNKDR